MQTSKIIFCFLKSKKNIILRYDFPVIGNNLTVNNDY
jgi:hypothetical protein